MRTLPQKTRLDSESERGMFLDLHEEAQMRVLLVDDDAAFLEVAEQCLGLKGRFRVQKARSVREAMKRLKKERFDAVVSDYQMPEQDGLEFLKELRDNGDNIPFIIFTGKGREQVAVNALNLGADQYLSKTGNPETVYGELAHGLRQVVESRRREERIRDSEEELRSIFNATLDGIAYVDVSGRILAANKRLVEDMLWYRLDETIGKNFVDLGRIDPKEVPRVLKTMARVVSTGEPVKNFEVALMRKDGSRIPTEINTGVVKTGDKVTGITVVIRDITERKEAEKALIEAEEKYRTLLDTANVLVQSVDAEGRFVYVNREWKKVLGYNGDDLEKITLTDIIRKGHREYCMRIFKQIVKGKSVRDIETVFVSKGGKEIIVRGNARPIVKEGKFISTVGLFVDITERKRAEELYRNVVEVSPSSIVTIDTRGVITSCNTTATKMLGYAKDEMLGKHFSETGIIRKEDLPEYSKLLGSALEGNVAKPLELVFQRKDGALLFAEVRVSLLKDGAQTVGIQAISTDITERKKTKLAVRKNQQMFEKLFRDNPEAAVLVDPDYRILDINPRFTELFGYSLAEIKDRGLGDVIVPEDKLEEGEMLDMKAKEGHVYHDSVRKRKDGSLVPVAISAAPISVEDQLIGYVGLYKDISELKSMQGAIRETMMKLAEMNEKLRVVGRLTRHDVRNKLSAAVGNIYLAKKLTDDCKVRERLQEVVSAVRQVEAIFEFARTYEMLGLEELAYMNVEMVFEKAVSLFPDLQRVEMVTRCEGLMVLADSLLVQVFYNLVQNSLTHGKKVSNIRVYHEEKGKDELRLIYEDNGVGIAECDKENVFKEGYGKGSGHGLYLIRKICEVYGWTVCETGKKNKGAQFTLTIPRKSVDGSTGYKLE